MWKWIKAKAKATAEKVLAMSQSVKRTMAVVSAVVSGVLWASLGLAVGVSQIDLTPLIDDVSATLSANLILVLSVLSITIGVPVAIHFIRKLIR